MVLVNPLLRAMVFSLLRVEPGHLEQRARLQLVRRNPVGRSPSTYRQGNLRAAWLADIPRAAWILMIGVSTD